MGNFRISTQTLRHLSLAFASAALASAVVIVVALPRDGDAGSVPILAFNTPPVSPPAGEPWSYAPDCQQIVSHVSFPDSDELRNFFNGINFDLAAMLGVTHVVPRVLLASLPDEARWVMVLSERYGASPGDCAELMRRVDTVSPALALAQAAEESGWATSRFAREGNAVFGQWSWRPGSGLVPMRRGDGAGHEVRSFDTLLDSVRVYATNLNTHPTYELFRAARAAQRAEGQQLDAAALAATLDPYSERGGGYIETRHAILRANRLQQFEGAQLAPP